MHFDLKIWFWGENLCVIMQWYYDHGGPKLQTFVAWERLASENNDQKWSCWKWFRPHHLDVIIPPWQLTYHAMVYSAYINPFSVRQIYCSRFEIYIRYNYNLFRHRLDKTRFEKVSHSWCGSRPPDRSSCRIFFQNLVVRYRTLQRT